MQLLRLEMKGFKSFADRTTIHFSPGMTAIIGPNGSGKSNITDAIRWVLGESNIRHLRGQKAEDIIFSGTEKRRAHGAAEVILVFDNQDGFLPNELAEVAVGRRLYRNGDSEFFINKRSCRLKDIHKLFADTGLGKDSMAIIGQNRVDAILNSKPEERRLIFEDVAGISGFKLNKEEALRRMAATEQNMERLKDVIITLEEQLAPLSEKAECTKAFEALQWEKRKYDGALALHKYKTAERLLTRLENESIALEDECFEGETELTNLEAHLGALRIQFKENREKVQEAEIKFADNQRQVERAQGQLLMLEEKIKVAEQSEKELVQRVEDVKKRRDEEEIAQHLLEEWISEKSKELEAEKDLIQPLKEAFANITEDVKSLQERWLSWQHTQQEKVEEQTARTSAMERVKTEIEIWRNRKVELETAFRESFKEVAVAKDMVDQVVQELSKEVESFAELKGREKRVIATLETEKAKRDEQEAQLFESESLYRRYKERLELLLAWKSDFEGFAMATKAVLTAKTPWKPQIIGAVGDLFTAEDIYATAIEVALGNAVNHVVTETKAVAAEAVSYLKEHQLGRATFLPLETVQGQVYTGPVLDEKGVIGIASSCLKYGALYKEIFAYLLGRTIVVDTLERGLNLQQKYKQQLRIVTLDGEQLQPGGAIVGGRTRKKQSSLIMRKKEEMHLKRECNRLAQELPLKKGEMENLEKRYLEATEEAEAMRQSLIEKEKQVVLMEADREIRKEQLTVVEKRHEEIEKEIENLEKQIKESTYSLELLQKEEAFDTKVKENEEIPEQLALTISKKQEEKQSKYENLTRLCLHYEQGLREVEEKKSLLLEKEKQIRSLADQLMSFETAILNAESRRKDILPGEKQEILLKIDELTGEESDLKRQRESLYKLDKQQQEEIEQISLLQQQVQQRMQRAQKKRIELEGKLTKNRMDLELADNELDSLGYTKEEANRLNLDGTVREWQERQQMLTAEMEALGPINPQAVSEYETALERHAFLRMQEEDLLLAKKRLEEVIQELNKAMAVRFEEMLSSVSTAFQQIFSKLFGGGTAQVVLTDEKHVLSGGVELFIQPPGKKRQPLPLLSGGERALTVIALLFAFLAYRPAPFCVLDEVDAALDEANLERFSHYMKELTDGTQFIVVSHRKKTMESAQVLQGVTMSERGISTLLTVNFDNMEGLE